MGTESAEDAVAYWGTLFSPTTAHQLDKNSQADREQVMKVKATVGAKLASVILSVMRNKKKGKFKNMARTTFKVHLDARS